jgi:OOP family OmpA-OmpF porin
MHRPSRWWLGLPILAVLLLAALWTRLDFVQTDVARNASAAAGGSELIDPLVSASGRDVRVSGLAPSDQARSQAVKTIDEARGVRLVHDDAKMMPTQKPYTFALSRTGEEIAATGFVPNPAVRAAAMKGAGALAPKTRDGLAYAAGAPAQFEAGVGAALAAIAPLKAGAATLTDNVLTVVGEAPDAASYAKALAATTSLPQGVTLGRFDVALPKVSPFDFLALREGAGVTLSGHAPDPATKARLLEAAAGLGVPVKDALTLGGGAPAGFETMAKTAIAALAPLRSGRAALSDATLTVSGQANDPAAYGRALAVAQNLPQGLSLGRFDVAAPKVSPYVFSAVRAGPELTLKGYAPDPAVRGRLLDAARQIAPQVSGGLDVASGAPAGFEAAAKAALGALAQLADGSATLVDGSLQLSGSAPSAGAREAILSALRAAGVTLGKIDVAAPPAPVGAATEAPPPSASSPPPGAPRRPLTQAEAVCHDRLLERLAEEKIQFDTGSARIAAASQGLVRKLAEEVKNCSDVDLEVEGHTDDVGDEDANMALSRARAEAVVKALTAAGAPSARLTAQGYGETRPIASNDTPEGRAQNRRIEFSVK